MSKCDWHDIEWSGMFGCTRDRCACPICENHKDQGHKPGCWLGEKVAKIDADRAMAAERKAKAVKEASKEVQE